MIRRAALIGGFVGVAMLAAATSAEAQGRGYPLPYRAFIGINPLGIPFDIGAIEAEGIVGPGITLGGAASYSAVGDDDGDDARFASGDVKVRYYPAEVALRGFSVGLGVGLTRYSENRFSAPSGASQREAVTAPTISVLADYNFLLGARERFVVATGLGAKRVLASDEDRDRTGIPKAYPFIRFVLGIAF